MHAAAHAGIVTAKKEGERPMLLPFIESHSLLAVTSCCLWIADPKGGWTHCVMRLEQECPIVQPVGHREKLISDRASRLKSFSPDGVQPQPPQRLKQLDGFSELLAQITRT